jgi:N,N'-diacetyllegionaminate synthase
MADVLQIGGRTIGGHAPALVIAEAGVNHNGDPTLAHALIDAAADAGADCIKFQSFVATEIVVPSLAKADYQQRSGDATESQISMLRALELNADVFAALMAHCERRGILFLSTPYDEPSVRMLDRLGVAGFKIASTDTTNTAFLRLVGGLGRPILLSTGMCTIDEVAQAVGTLEAEGANFALLQCTSQYPAPVADTNLRAMRTLESRFGRPVGFSDHTEGLGVSAWAVAAGACIIEKHFTLDRRMDGPDHAASIEPAELRELVGTIRAVETALGDGIKRIMPSEAGNKPMMQKRLVARRALLEGEAIDADMLACKRAPSGLPASAWDSVMGRKTARAIAANESITAEHLHWQS